MSLIKTCSKCNTTKEVNLFRKRAELSDGYSSWCKDCHKLHRLSVADRERENNRRWYIENSEYAKKVSRDYKVKNRDKISARDKLRYRDDVQYRLKQNLRSRMRSYIKADISVTIDTNLGCSIEELKSHLENQFQSGMSWRNHGEWHIDHIKPLASFDLTKEEELKKACHYTNLQPLWAEENLSKGATIE